MTPFRIIGIDPGLNTTGYAVIESGERRVSLIEAGIIQPTKDSDSRQLEERLKSLYTSLGELLDQLQPQVMAVEQLYAHYEHPRTAILMGHARGVIFLAGGMRDLTIHSYAATQIKKVITGSGRASKEQMQMAMLREFALTEMPEPADVADAIAIALCHHYLQRMPASTTTPNSQGTAIIRETRVKLPPMNPRE